MTLVMLAAFLRLKKQNLHNSRKSHIFAPMKITIVHITPLGCSKRAEQDRFMAISYTPKGTLCI
jgi:hypothetical protein